MIKELYGTEQMSPFAPTTQVYKATHDRKDNRLSFRERSFISFSFGGRLIEDFGLVATIDGDRMERLVYSNFEDAVENYVTRNGQIYWGTHLSYNELNLKLSTDGFTARQLDDFKEWFAPGKIRELILMEHPNRAIMARVSTPPQFSMLPFATSTSLTIGKTTYSTEVTLFKGDIILTFVMDEPFWYAKYNIITPNIIGGGANGVLDIKGDPLKLKKYLDDNFKQKGVYIKYRDSNGKIVQTLIHYSELWIPTDENDKYVNGYWAIKGTFDNGKACTMYYPNDIISIESAINTLYEDTNISADSKDYIKIILEDNIPHVSMVKDKVLLGENTGVANDAEGRVYNNSDEIINEMLPWTGAHVLYYGYVHEGDTREWAENVEISKDNPQYLFYSGTAPSCPILEFIFNPVFNNNHYISLPKNQYSHGEEILKEKNYNYIAIDDNYFYFTTPSLLTGYNQAINIIKNFPIDGTGIFNELIISLKEQINEYYARAWAVFCAKSLEKNTNYVNTNSSIKENFPEEFIRRMKYLFCEDGITPCQVNCSFNSKNGIAIVTFYGIREADRNPENLKENTTFNQVMNDKAHGIKMKKQTENAGDMVKSDYLIIDGRNYPDYMGEIHKEQCHIVTTDFEASNPLTGLLITFKNMYY